MKKKYVIFGFVLACIAGVFLGGKTVGAASNNTVELQKALLAGVRYCYVNGNMKADFGVLTNYMSWGNIVQSDGGGSFVKLPNGYTGVRNNDVSCKELLAGYGGTGGSFEGLFALAGITPPTGRGTYAEKDGYLTGMGYDKIAGTSGRCAAFQYKVDTSTSTSAGAMIAESEQYVYTYHLCAPIVNSDGTIGSDKLEVVKEGGQGDIAEFEVGKAGKMTLDCELNLPTLGGCKEHAFTKGSTNWNTFVSGVLGDLAANRGTVLKTRANGKAGVTNITYTLQSDVKQTNYGDVNARYKLKSPLSNAADAATRYLSGGKYASESALRYSAAEQVVLYQTYIEDYYGADVRCNQEYTDNDLTVFDAQGYLKVRLYKEGQFNTGCYVLAKNHANDKVNGLTDSRGFSQERTFAELVRALNASTVATLTAEQGASLGDTVTDLPPGQENPNTVTTPPGEEKAEEADKCFSNSGALGWIVCPVLTMGNFALESVYGWIEQNYLSVNSNIFTDANTGVQSTWSTVRDVANVIFVILLLVVIFSQLTGFWIDNYGIKKILPKLIVAAILINVSFIVCQLAVDLSNILGFGLKGVLENAVPLSPEADKVGVRADGMQVGADLFIGAGVLAAVIQLNPAVIITLLIFLVTALISVVFMWIILLVRQIGVILAVIVSPLAFACYLLPNTQALFKRWVNLFKGLLLVFPLCSLLIGGGIMGSRILANVGASMGAGEGTAFMLAAMVLQVVPFFFVPMLLKGSLAGLGNIGAKLSGLGSGLRKRANVGLNNMEGVKQQKSRLNAGVNSKNEVNRLGKIRAAVAGKTGIGRRTIARGRDEAIRAKAERSKIDRLNDPAYLAAAAARQEAEVENEQVKTEEALITQSEDANNTAALGAELEKALKDDKAGENSARIRALQNVLSSKGDAGRTAVHDAMKNAGTVSDKARTAYANNIMNNWAKDYKDNSRSTYDYAVANTGASAGQIKTTNSHGNEVSSRNATLADYEAHSTGSLKQEQLATMDEGELKRYAAALASGSLVNADEYDSSDAASVLRLGADNAAAAATLQEQVYNTLNNPQLRNSLKPKQREILERMVSGYTPTNEVAARGQVVGTQRITRGGVSEVVYVRGDGTLTDSDGHVVPPGSFT